MPFRTLRLKPGVNLVESPALNTFQLAQSNLIRFYGGLVQKLGGWVQMAAQAFVGTASAIHGWGDILGNPYVAIGTEQRLQMLESGSILDITPLAATDSVAVNFSTIGGSTAVSIIDASYNPNANDWINLQTQVSIGGIVLFGYYQVASVTNSTTYVVNAATPAVSTVNNGGAVPSYTTSNTQPAVNVLLNNHGLVTGNLYNAVVTTTVATVVIFGIYSVVLVDANNFTITASSNANATTTASENGGNVQIQYLLPTGTVISTGAAGYGAGDYGGGDYGGSSSTGQITLPSRQWSLDHWGQDLIACPSRGKIYYWVPPTTAQAIVLSGTAPLYNVAVFVMPQAQIIISLGAEVGGTLQPLLARWCDAGDFTDWTVSATNQVGSYLVPTGSRLVGGIPVGLGALIWTDEDAWSLTYLNFPLVFGFNNIGPKCGLISARAAASAGELIMWLSIGQFNQSSPGGGVQPVECPVWDFYWNNVDRSNFSLIFSAVNSLFNEIAWHFPIATTSPLWSPLTIFGYVKFNYVEQVWDYGISLQYQRTAWAPLSPAGFPIGADLNGLLQQHEVGFDANGSAMLWSWQTGLFDLAEGHDFMFSDFLIPDFVTIGQPQFIPNLLMSDSSNGPSVQVATQMFGESTFFITYSARGRYMSIGFLGPSSDVGTFNRLGAIHIMMAPDGKQS